MKHFLSDLACGELKSRNIFPPFFSLIFLDFVPLGWVFLVDRSPEIGWFPHYLIEQNVNRYYSKLELARLNIPWQLYLRGRSSMRYNGI